jgi:hypothetical protein
MAWRFVIQPNGKLARFTEVCDDFTHLNMSRAEALQAAVNEYNCGPSTAAQKIANAMKPKEVSTRWNQALEIIREIHGEDQAIVAIEADQKGGA